MVRPLQAALVVGSVIAGMTASQHARAQELRVGVARVGSDHELLGTSTALGANIGAPLSPSVGVRLGLQHGRAEFSSLGSTCVGLVPPDENCGPELSADESTTTAFFVGLSLTASLGRGRVGFVPGVRRLSMKSRQEGTTSGRVRTAKKVAYGFGVGAELDYFLWDRPGVALHAGVHSAWHPWFEEDIIADGYTPFETSVRLTWLELGMTVRR